MSRVSPLPRSWKYTPTAFAGVWAIRAIIAARSESRCCAAALEAARPVSTTTNTRFMDFPSSESGELQPEIDRRLHAVLGTFGEEAEHQRRQRRRDLGVHLLR